MNELSAFKKGGRWVNYNSGRYKRPKKTREIPERMMRYEFADQMAREIKPEVGMKFFCVLSGRFIAGDFIEAWVVAHNIHVKRMTISTLSLSEANVDSLANILNGGFVEDLNLIVSDYFFSHERRNLIPYIYDQLDKENKFQLAVAGTHCKMCLIETVGGSKVVMHGSANLRSSGNMEQICIEENKPLYDFNFEIQEAILKTYSTIKKAARHDVLWKAVNSK